MGEVEFNYKDIGEFIREVESLGDWRNPEERKKYLNILAQLVVVYNGYEKDGERQFVPTKVYDTLGYICSKKFPGKNDIFIGDEAKPEYKDDISYSYLPFATSSAGIHFVGERGILNELIGRAPYQWINERMGSNAEAFIESAERYYDTEIPLEHKLDIEAERDAESPSSIEEIQAKKNAKNKTSFLAKAREIIKGLKHQNK